MRREVAAVVAAGVAWEEPGSCWRVGWKPGGWAWRPASSCPGVSTLCGLRWAEPIFMPASYRTLFSVWPAGQKSGVTGSSWPSLGRAGPSLRRVLAGAGCGSGNGVGPEGVPSMGPRGGTRYPYLRCGLAAEAYRTTRSPRGLSPPPSPCSVQPSSCPAHARPVGQKTRCRRPFGRALLEERASARPGAGAREVAGHA